MTDLVGQNFGACLPETSNGFSSSTCVAHEHVCCLSGYLYIRWLSQGVVYSLGMVSSYRQLNLINNT